MLSGAGQNIATHASPSARNVFLVSISTLSVHSLLFVANPLPTFFNFVFCVDPQNRIGHPADSQVPVVSAYGI